MSIDLRVRCALFGLLIAGLVQSANATEAVDQACLDCHREAASRGAIPIIEGQHYEYLLAQLQRFAEHHREGFPMNALAAGLDTARAEALATALANRDWPAPSDSVGADTAQQEHEGAASPEPSPPREFEGGQLAALDCAACHGPSYLGGGVIPRLAGQREDYLQRQIEGFGHAQRHHPPVAGGARMYMIDATEAAALARALSSLR